MARLSKPSREKLGLTQTSVETGSVLTAPEQITELYKRVFTGSEGAALLDDLKKRYGNRRSFVPDSNTTAFYEGQRDVYLMILSHVERVNRKPQTQENDD